MHEQSKIRESSQGLLNRRLSVTQWAKLFALLLASIPAYLGIKSVGKPSTTDFPETTAMDHRLKSAEEMIQMQKLSLEKVTATSDIRTRELEMEVERLKGQVCELEHRQGWGCDYEGQRR